MIDEVFDLKVRQLIEGLRVIASDSDMDRFEQLPFAKRLASIWNPNRVGTLDAYVVWLSDAKHPEQARS